MVEEQADRWLWKHRDGIGKFVGAVTVCVMLGLLFVGWWGAVAAVLLLMLCIGWLTVGIMEGMQR